MFAYPSPRWWARSHGPNIGAVITRIGFGAVITRIGFGAAVTRIGFGAVITRIGFGAVITRIGFGAAVTRIGFGAVITRIRFGGRGVYYTTFKKKQPPQNIALVIKFRPLDYTSPLKRCFGGL